MGRKVSTGYPEFDQRKQDKGAFKHPQAYFKYVLLIGKTSLVKISDWGTYWEGDTSWDWWKGSVRWNDCQGKVGLSQGKWLRHV